ncbi:MAG: alpha/beta hydrolase [Minicystis sp.]
MSGGWDEARGRIEVGDHALACAVTRPRRGGLHPAVLLLPPLGPRARTGPLAAAPPHDGIAALLRDLADAGFVTLRADPCGAGESGGPAYAEASLEADLEGHRAALEAIASLPFVEPARVFVLGLSLGGVLAPLVVAGAEVRGIAVYGTPSRRWSECLADTARRQLTLAGLADDARDREAARAARLYDLVLRAGTSPATIARDHPDLAACRAAADLGPHHLHGRALHYFRALDCVDPEAAWGRVTAPVLALRGEHDFILADDDPARIAAFVTASGGRARALTLPGLDHDLLRQPDLAASFAQRGRGAPDPSAARALIAWMRAESEGTPPPRFTPGPPAGDTGGTTEV